MKAGLLLLAAGEGERLGGSVPKALMPLGGMLMLQRSLIPFLAILAIREIIVAAPPRHLGDVQALVSDKPGVRVVCGGQTRQESARRALHALSQDVELVVVHDAARPLITKDSIEAVLSAAEEHGAAIVGVPITDTVKRVRGGFVEATLRREVLWAAQTPQAFRRSLYQEAHERAEAEGFITTDDASLIEHFGLCTVTVVQGSVRNIKITHPEDLVLAEFYLAHP
ncbi:MAG: 2-C-methyl-D-erythritol 4-phosphate cytidylyltransferase [bacterium]